jgi:hypothetical protein
MSEPIQLNAEQVLQEQVRILAGRIAQEAANAAGAQAAANVLAARVAELERQYAELRQAAAAGVAEA